VLSDGNQSPKTCPAAERLQLSCAYSVLCGSAGYAVVDRMFVWSSIHPFMTRIAIEAGIILLLLLANGVFAMAEIAIVASRKNRLRQSAASGNTRAQAALELAESPNRFLATVQIGITLIGILAGAFGGATIAEELGRAYAAVPFLAEYAQVFGVATVVIAVTFVSLIVGELAPKRIGLLNPEAIASALAKPMRALSKATAPIVTLLSATTDALVRLFGIRAKQEPPVSEEDVRTMVEQGLHAGVFHKIERQVVEGAFRLDQLQVRELMTPRTRIVWLNLNDPDEVNWRKTVASGHSSFPAYEGNRDNVAGLVSIKAVWANLALTGKAELRNLVTDPLMVPAVMSATKLLETFKKAGKRVALVADEFGGIQGLVSLTDVLEAIIGEVPSGDKPRRQLIQERDDGSWLADGLVDIDELKKRLQIRHLPREENDEYQTLAGFILSQLGHIPEEGEKFEREGLRFEVIDMDKHRIDKVLIKPSPRPGSEAKI
jgi:putative hemolysin